MYTNIPAELRALNQWVVAYANKLPLDPKTGHAASVTDSTTWGSFEQAQATGLMVGFVLSPDDPYAIIDLDNKPDKPATPEEIARHHKILDAFDSYTELSASGTGYHIIVRGRLPTGVHRGKVEAYSSGRYMICTGNVVRMAPINDHQALLDILYGEMAVARQSELVEVAGSQSDEDVFNMAMNARNGAKFNALCCGDMTGYPSQSEADFALLSILAFYTPENEQVRRLFRMTALGKREKAQRNDTYLDFALGKIRAQQPPPIDFSQVAANAAALVKTAQEKKEPAAVRPEPPPAEPDTQPKRGRPKTVNNQTRDHSALFPPGLVGDLSRYFYATAIRPVPEVALAAALAITAGVCGRSYNISGAGLNQYIVLLAKTGSGKEGALSGIDRLLAAVRPQLPMVDQFLGPAVFSSGQALIKVLSERPCFASVLGEFGLTLQQLSDHRANPAQLMLRRVLLDLFSKSGWEQVLRASVYADTEKNTKIVQAPAVTILGESTPETFFDGLDTSHIAEGLIPRFSVIEYLGDRPPRNRKANVPPPPELIARFSELVMVSLTTTNNHSCMAVQTVPEAAALLDTFDARADSIMNASVLDTEAMLWNRAHLKSLKLSALLAVGVSPHNPVVTADLAQWAIDFTNRDIRGVADRFVSGDVGQGNGKQHHDLKAVVEAYFDRESSAVHSYDKQLWNGKIIPYRTLCRRTASLASFRTDKGGATAGLRGAIQVMLDSGMLIEVSPQVLLKDYAFSGKAYVIGSCWR